MKNPPANVKIFDIRTDKAKFNTNLRDLSGQEFNRWIVGYLFFKYQCPSKKNRKTYWQCTCECGEIRWVDAGDLNGAHHQSCGCLTKDNTRKRHYKGNEYISGQAINSIINGANRRNIKLPSLDKNMCKQILLKQIKILYERQSGKCAYCNNILKTIICLKDHSSNGQGRRKNILSLDRIDSMKGYDDFNNLQLLCHNCNNIKGPESENTHLEFAKMIEKAQQKRADFS